MSKRLPVLLMLGFMAAATHAAGTIDEIRARGVLRVCVKNEGAISRVEHNDPAHFQKRNLELELAGRIAERILGDASKLDLQVFKRRFRLQAVADRAVDIGISMFPVNEENSELVDFSEPYYSGGLAIMQRSASTVRQLSDLDGKTIVAMEEKSHDPGGELQRRVAALGSKVEIEYVSNFLDGAAMVESGEVFGMVGMNANLDAFIRDGHPQFQRSPLLTHEQYAVAVPKGDGDLLATVNAVISELKASGKMTEMLHAHGLFEE